MRQISIISISWLLIFAVFGCLAGCDHFRSPPFFVIFDENNASVQQLQPGAKVYRGGFKIGEVTSKSLRERGIRVGIVLDKEYRTRVTRDSKFYIDIDHMNSKHPGRMGVFVIVPSGSHDLVTPGETLDGGVNSSVMWDAYQKEFSVEKKIDELHNNLKNNSALYRNFLAKKDAIVDDMREFANDLQRTVSEADWPQIGSDVEDDLINLQQQVDRFVNGGATSKSYDKINKKINTLMDKIAGLKDKPEAKRLMAILRHLRSKLNQQLSN